MSELSVKKKYYETISNTVIKNLSKRQIEGIYGPENVLIIAGVNKIVSNVEEGISRTRNMIVCVDNM